MARFHSFGHIITKKREPCFCSWKARALKGIVSRTFEVCFLVPLDSSDIATPDIP
jgi:hypothetical protein